MLTLIGAHRRESVGIFLGFAATLAILVNALFLQPAQHPAPLWSSRLRPVAEPAPAPALALPRPRPAEVQAAPAAAVATPSVSPAAALPAVPRARGEIITDIQRELTRRGYYDGAVDGIWGSKTDGALRDFAQAAGLRPPFDASEELLRVLMKAPFKPGAKPAGEARNDPIGELIAPTKRVLAVQRALADFGYGQIKPTGTFGPDTQAAIEKFERERRLPVTGQISDRLVRELAAVTARPLE